MKRQLITLVFAFAVVHAHSQDANTLRSNCQTELNDMSGKITALNTEYEAIKRDMKAGLYCSKCGMSKTELDKTEGFQKHLGRVSGTAVPATQTQMDDAHQRYMDKYNNLKDNYESKKKNCETNINNAINAQNERLQQERTAAFNEQQQRLAEQQQRLADYQRQVLEESEKQKEKIKNTFDELGQSLKDGIRQLNTNKNGEVISFKNKHKQSENTGKDLLEQVKDIDDMDEFNVWHARSVEYLANKYPANQRPVFEEIYEATNDPGSADRLTNFFTDLKDYGSRVRENLSNELRSYINNLPDDALDDLIDESTEGQTNRNLHYIKDAQTDLVDRTMNLTEAAFDMNNSYEDVEQHFFEPEDVFIEHMPTLTGANEMTSGYNLRDIYNRAKEAATDPKVMVNVATWVFAPEIRVPVFIMTALAK